MTFTTALFLFFTLFAQQETGTLTIHAGHFEHDNGTAVVRLYREQDDMPKRYFREASGVIIDGASVIVIENIPYGEYGAILFHDENSNGELDHSWGFPAEPIGFSNEWELTLFSGMPSFKKLRFEFSPKNPECKISFR